MSVFSLDYTAGDDEKKIKDYLFMLNTQLQYMFSNLDPEENFAETSLNYVRQDEAFSIIEAGAKKISWILSDGESESNFSLSSRMVELLSENVKIEGIVKFTDLSRTGSTVINGANIKTGTVKAVCSLAGYLDAANGHRYAFVLMNTGMQSSRPVREWQDKVCNLLCK